jgi:hypothetical protein
MRHSRQGFEVPGGRFVSALLRAAAMACVILGASTSQAARLTVTNNNDSRSGSLRAEWRPLLRATRSSSLPESPARIANRDATNDWRGVLVCASKGRQSRSERTNVKGAQA